MTTWYSSWLPGLPSVNLALSSTIQSRFISFLLKKTLGHLLKPGQLDSRQIESQIGSGYVQVNDLELNNEGINTYLDGLPVELREGSVSSVIARIPWPNPLTSSIGFSVKSLKLVFYLRSTSKSQPQMNINLADSVASMADSFIHEELSPPEGIALWESLRSDIPLPVDEDERTVPGSMSTDDKEEKPFDGEPVGVSIFATLIERLLARFEFDAEDLQITLVHLGSMSVTARISRIRYHTDDDDNTKFVLQVKGETRILSITGITISTRDLRTSIPTSPPPNSATLSPTPSHSSPNQATPLNLTPPGSPGSSSSSIDEDTQFAMSQSLAFLPPRATPPGSVASSIYASAISTMPPSHENAPEVTSFNIQEAGVVEREEESRQDIEGITLLSFGSTALTIRLTTPSPVQMPPGEHQESSSGSDLQNKLQVSSTVGVMACVLHAWQIRSFIALADAWMSYRSISPPSSKDMKDASTSIPLNVDIEINVAIRCFVCLLLLSGLDSATQPLVEGYFARPLVPPQLSHDYLRLHLDGLSASISTSFINPKKDPLSTSRAEIRTPKGTEVREPVVSSLLSVGDVSLFAFQKRSNVEELVATPILITDYNLPLQYSSPHIHPQDAATSNTYPLLPTFEVLDWRDPKFWKSGLKLSLWRSPATRKTAKMGATQLSAFTIRGYFFSQSQAQQRRAKTVPSVEIGIDTAPLHVFVDLGQLLKHDGLLAFLDEALEYDPKDSKSDLSEDINEGPEAEENAPLATPRSHQQEKERKRLEQFVFEDLELQYDYRTYDLPPERSTTKSAHKRKRQINQGLQVLISLSLPMVRVVLRCPPPPDKDSRSGAVVVDFHELTVNNFPTLKPRTRFESDNPSQRSPFNSESPNRTFLLGAESNRIVAACALIGSDSASCFFSMGPLKSRDMDLSLLEDIDTTQRSLNPRITITSANKDSDVPSPVMALTVDFPSVHVDMSKCVLDSLQYLADDVAQLLEQTLDKDRGESSAEKGSSKDSSLIGSRFFVKSRSGSGSGFSTNSAIGSGKETVVKMVISEAFVRVGLPRIEQSPLIVRPFDFAASDVDILLELHPEGKEQTVVTLGVMDITVKDTLQSGEIIQFFSLTSPRSLMSSPKSLVKLRFTSLVVPETISKESRLKLTLCGFTFNIFPDVSWLQNLTAFAKSPPGTFESVIPSERTRVSVKVVDGSIRALAPNHPGAIVVYVGDLDFSTDVIGKSPDLSFRIMIPSLDLLAIDDIKTGGDPDQVNARGTSIWKSEGYAVLGEIEDLDMNLRSTSAPASTLVEIDHVALRIHICADSVAAVIAFTSDVGSAFASSNNEEPQTSKRPTIVSEQRVNDHGLMGSVEDLAFKQIPEIGPAPDMINDDLPTNPDYLDESFGAAAGLRELRDEDLEEFDDKELEEPYSTASTNATGVTSRIGGETIRVIHQNINIVENYFDTLPPDTSGESPESQDTALRVRVRNSDLTLFLYDGYDWVRTRKTIEDEVKEMRRRLAKIRQLVASGQTQDPSVEETNALLFNSVYIGLEQDIETLEPGALIAAIDEELKDDASQSSWQSLHPPSGAKQQARSTRIHGKRLTRSKGPSMEFRLLGVNAEVDHYRQDAPLVSRKFVTVTDLEILDHIKTSTWKKFLTGLRSDSRGNIRESESNMVRIELRNVHPVPGHIFEEARLRAKILPLRLYVDQDAVDFLKKFFSFKDKYASPPQASSDENEAYIQLAEIFPIDLKLDYKPRRVDYRALREGRTIELMNFFHFDGAEMTLRHITLAGVTGWARLFEMLNDLWTPDVKATQLVEVISGVAPIRSVVNVGSGVADLILLPISQYKKDGRIVRGVQKGATAFVKSTAIEAIKMGARLATGTQVILEQAEGVLGGQFNHPITTETVQPSVTDDFSHGDPDLSADEEDVTDLYSKYAQQPTDIKEGMQSAYKSLSKNFSSAAQTILAVPMEVYERSGNEGAVRSVIRAVPIAVLKPMIGASEAVSKTLQGLHNTLDPNLRHDNEAKYKRR